jgi:hypothetical protein
MVVDQRERLSGRERLERAQDQRMAAGRRNLPDVQHVPRSWRFRGRDRLVHPLHDLPLRIHGHVLLEEREVDLLLLGQVYAKQGL